MIGSGRAGFTIIEVVVAILILSVGILAIAGTDGRMTRMIARGSQATAASTHAQSQLERLRSLPCAALTNGNATVEGVFQLEWTIATPASGRYRGIELIIRYPSTGGTREDRFATTRHCVT